MWGGPDQLLLGAVGRPLLPGKVGRDEKPSGPQVSECFVLGDVVEVDASLSPSVPVLSPFTPRRPSGE